MPIAIFVGFNMVYILVGFIYLSPVNIRERPPEDETAFLENHHRIPHTWISLLLFALFADNLVRWWEGAEGSHWFWLLSGQIGAVLIFAGLSVADPFPYLVTNWPDPRWAGVDPKTPAPRAPPRCFRTIPGSFRQRGRVS